LKILYATAEALPYYKSGGLADVSRALPDALARRGHDVRILHPYYRGLNLPSDLPTEGTLPVRWRHGTSHAELVIDEPGDGRAMAALLRQPALFEEHGPYADRPADPLGQGIRFAYFSRAVVAYARTWGADVVHVNDWHTGLVPVYAQLDGLDAPTVLAIHNLAYQGNFAPTILPEIDVPAAWHRTENGVEFHGNVSFLKAGIALADRLVTVSPTYAREIQTPAFGGGLDGLLRFRRRLLHGILNGIDREVWNPARDPFLPHTYHIRALGGKQACRTAVLEATGLDDGGPLLVAISRLVYQKGIDILLHAAPALIESGARIVVLGDGDDAMARALDDVRRRFPRRLATIAAFDDPLAHRLYAGGDFFVMPSRYEPCGLGQMIAQRYGTPPIATRTGGLADTIEDGRTGFLLESADVHSLMEAARRAIAGWRDSAWTTLRRRCMRLDWSWDRSAAAYEQVYRMAIGAIPELQTGP
jgi:starch synthase